jgi:hypothetical protein
MAGKFRKVDRYGSVQCMQGGHVSLTFFYFQKHYDDPVYGTRTYILGDYGGRFLLYAQYRIYMYRT